MRPPTSFNFHPPLKACLVFSARLLGALVLCWLVLSIVIDVVKGRSLSILLISFSAAMATFFLAGTALLGISIYLCFRISAWSMNPLGLAGRNYWGRKSQLSWNEIASATPFTVEGIPGFMATSAAHQQVYGCVLGLDIADAHEHLFAFAGAEHPLTRLFEASFLKHPRHCSRR